MFDEVNPFAITITIVNAPAGQDLDSKAEEGWSGLVADLKGSMMVRSPNFCATTRALIYFPDPR